MNPRARVLYVDDDPGLGRLVLRSLTRAGFEVEHALSGAAGLELARSKHFDVVALDHHMPEQTGLDILPHLRALPDAPPIVYVTGSEDSRVAVAALKGGASDYVWKDVQGHFQELLVQAIAGALEKDEMRRAREAADREVREARDRAELLLKEMNHRIGNSLAMVAATARLQMGSIADPAAKAALAEMHARIQAIGGVHRRLYTSGDVQNVELRAYLSGLVSELEASARAVNERHRILLDAEPVTVTTDAAVAVGMIVTELITNSLKYAYPGGTEGEVRVRLHRSDGMNHVRVEDDGVGWRGAGDIKGTGLGMRIIKAMASNLASEIEFDQLATGTRAKLSFAGSS